MLYLLTNSFVIIALNFSTIGNMVFNSWFLIIFIEECIELIQNLQFSLELVDTKNYYYVC